MSDPIGYNGSYVDEDKVLEDYRWQEKFRKAQAAAGEQVKRTDQIKRIADRDAFEVSGPTLKTLQLLQEGPLAFTVKDSGKRAEFASGMVRDTEEGKVDYTTILDGPMFDRWAEHLTKAKAKYPDVAPGVANWTLASGREELVRFRKSAFRHFRQWLRGDVDEDHAAAVLYNINGYEYVKARMAEEREKKAA